MCKAIDVANFIINTIPVDNLKLQKLLFYSQAVHLVLTKGIPLFSDRIEAWMYGPVIPSVYKKFKKYGFEQIPQSQNSTAALSEAEIKSINIVIGFYGNMSGVQLIARTHAESPWQDAYVQGKRNILISNKSIYNYFKDAFEFEEDII